METLWSKLINFDEFYSNQKTESFYEDEKEEKVIDISDIEFSLNNENILKEVYKILNLEDVNNLTSLQEILSNALSDIKYKTKTSSLLEILLSFT